MHTESFTFCFNVFNQWQLFFPLVMTIRVFITLLVKCNFPNDLDSRNLIYSTYVSNHKVADTLALYLSLGSTLEVRSCKKTVNKVEREMNLDAYAHSQKQSRVGPMKSGHEFTGRLLRPFMITFFFFNPLVLLFFLTFFIIFIGVTLLNKICRFQVYNPIIHHLCVLTTLSQIFVWLL